MPPDFNKITEVMSQTAIPGISSAVLKQGDIMSKALGKDHKSLDSEQDNQASSPSPFNTIKGPKPLGDYK